MEPALEELAGGGVANAQQLQPSTALGGSGATSQLSSPYDQTTKQQEEAGAVSDSTSRSSGDDKDDPNGLDGRGRLSNKRTPKQQLQNKQAQQRYRQRRKQKLVEMEQALEVLTQKVQDMQAVQSQNYYLAGRAAQLEQALKSKEVEVSKLRQLISQHHVSSSRGGGSAPVLDPEHMKKSFVESVEDLKEFVTLCDLRNVDTSGLGVPEDVIVRCRSLVQAASKQCVQAMSADNPAVLSIISRDPGKLSTGDNQIDRARWLKVVEALQLTEEQVECILQVRSEQLKKLRGIYEERAMLHARAVDALLPGGSEEALTQQLRHLNLNGFLYTVKDIISVSSVLDALKDNLRAEQRSLVDFNYMLTTHILSPIQAALLYVDAFPFHCDTLALANALAVTRGEVPDPTTLPAEFHPAAAAMRRGSPLSLPDPILPHPHAHLPVVHTASSNTTTGGRLPMPAGPHHPPLHSPHADHIIPPARNLSLNHHSPTISGMDTTSPRIPMGHHPRHGGGHPSHGQAVSGPTGHQVVVSGDHVPGGRHRA